MAKAVDQVAVVKEEVKEAVAKAVEMVAVAKAVVVRGEVLGATPPAASTSISECKIKACWGRWYKKTRTSKS